MWPENRQQKRPKVSKDIHHVSSTLHYIGQEYTSTTYSLRIIFMSHRQVAQERWLAHTARPRTLRLRSTLPSRLLDFQWSRRRKHLEVRQVADWTIKRKLEPNDPTDSSHIYRICSPSLFWHHYLGARHPQTKRRKIQHPLQRERGVRQHEMQADRVRKPPLHPPRHHEVFGTTFGKRPSSKLFAIENSDSRINVWCCVVSGLRCVRFRQRARCFQIQVDDLHELCWMTLCRSVQQSNVQDNFRMNTRWESLDPVGFRRHPEELAQVVLALRRVVRRVSKFTTRRLSEKQDINLQLKIDNTW